MDLPDIVSYIIYPIGEVDKDISPIGEVVASTSLIDKNSKTGGRCNERED